MKIAFIVTSLARKGPILVIQDIVCNLPVDWDITVFYFDDVVEVSFSDNIITRKISFFKDCNIFNDFDLVHSHLLRPDIYCAFFGRSARAKIISTLHSDYKFDLEVSYGKVVAKIASYFWTLALKQFDQIVMLTQVQSNKYNFFDNVQVINNGRPEVAISINPIIAHIKKQSEGLILLGACAYIVKRKSFDTVLRFLNSSEGSNYAFCLVGDGPEKLNLQNMVEELGLSDRVFFIEKTNEVLSYVAGFDVFVMSSSSEGMPLSIIESASLKIPVLSTKLPVIKEVFSEDEISYFDYDVLPSFDLALKNLINNKKQYSINIYNKFISCYTDKIMAERYRQCYLNLIR